MHNTPDVPFSGVTPYYIIHHLDVSDVRCRDDLLQVAQRVGLGERVDELVLDDGLLNFGPGHAEVQHQLLERPVALSGLDDLAKRNEKYPSARP